MRLEMVPEVRTTRWRLADGMHSLEQRKRAAGPYIKYGLKATAAIRELGYSSRARLASWRTEWQENRGRLTDRNLEQCTLEQKRAAVRHCLTHGRRNAFTRREPGCPKCTAKPAERIDGHAPGERRATRPRVFDASGKAASVKALVSRASSAQEVAGLAGCTSSCPGSLVPTYVPGRTASSLQYSSTGDSRSTANPTPC